MHHSLPNGFTSRAGSLEDIPIAVELFNTYATHYLGIQNFQISDLETDWTRPKFYPATDINLVFNPKDKLVGYIEVSTTSTPPVHPWIWGRVHPEYNHLSLGTFLLNWAEQRAFQALEKCPQDVRVAYRTGTFTTIEPPKALYHAQGLNLIRHFFRMLIDLETAPPEATWPAGITIRTPDDPEKAIEAIYKVDYEAFKDHFGHVDQPFEEGLADYSHWFLKNEKNNDPALWFLAMDGDEIAGIALCIQHDPEDETCGHVDSLAVLKPYRKRGIGLALLHHAFGEYYQRGYRKVSLGVDANNLTGALKLYEKAGMSINRQFDVFEKELRPGKEISVESLGD